MSDGIGARVKRREDKRFITGKGKYTDEAKVSRLSSSMMSRPMAAAASPCRSGSCRAWSRSMNPAARAARKAAFRLGSGVSSKKW